ncbi:nuclear pore complex protein Nup153-like isoform X3 [Argopecten irradians]|uniref:nuclear pore complex protein Nup153-like isoform X3 n=1 Tax=Argopecten irradians TaxID=31199 RepID=UPI003710EAB4
MSEEGGGKIRNKKVANQTKPYERRKSFLGKVTDTVKELISPSWLSDLVNSVKKPSPQKDEQPIPPAQEPQYMSSLQSHQQHNRIQSKDGYPPKFVPLTRNGIANLSPRASLPLAPSIPSHQSLQPQPTSTFSTKKSNIESPRTGDVSMKSQVQSNTFLQDSKPVNGNRNFLSDCTSGRDRLQSDSSAGPGDVISEPSHTQVNPADISSACNHSESIDNEELEDTLPPSVNRLNKSTTWTEGFTARKQKFTDRYKPGFDISLFGAPLQNNSLLGESSHESSFYPGKTTYGGASAQSKRRLNVTGPYQTSFPVHQKMKVRPTTSKSAVTSSSAQKILESLEKMSTPLSEAKKIPIDDTVMRLNSSFNPANYKPARHSIGSSYLNTRRELQKSQSGPPTGKLSTPVPVSISRNYQQVTLPQPSKSFLSEKSSTSSCQPTSQEHEKASSTTSGGGKLKSKKFQQHLPGRRSAEDEADEVEIPNLRTDFTLPIIGTPQFDFGTSQPTKSAKPIEKIAEKTNLEFKFSTPIQKTPTKQLDKVPSAKKDFTFSSPLSMNTEGNIKPKSVTFDIEQMKNKEPPAAFSPAFKFGSPKGLETKFSSNLGASPVLPKPSAGVPTLATELKSGSVMDFLNKSEEKGFNFNTGSMSTKSPEKTNTTSFKSASELKQGGLMNILGSDNFKSSSSFDGSFEPAKELKKGSVMDILGKSSTTEPSNEPSLSSMFKAPEGSWTCDTCMIQNKSGDTKCVACQSKKPGATATPAPSNEQSLSSMFKAPEGSWTCDICMIQNKSGDTKCVACQSKKPGATAPATSPVKESLAAKFKKPTGNWDCDTCLVPNVEAATKCIACETPRPGLQPSSITNATGLKIGGVLVTDSAGSVGKGGFKFGNADQGGFVFGSASKDSSTDNKTASSSGTGPAFSFGLPVMSSKTSTSETTKKTDVTGGFKFGSLGSAGDIKVGAADSTPNASPSTGFKFGSLPTSKNAADSMQNAAPSTGFKFGSLPTSKSDSVTGGFQMPSVKSSPVGGLIQEKTESSSTFKSLFGVDKSEITSAPKADSTSGNVSNGSFSMPVTSSSVGGFTFEAPKKAATFSAGPDFSKLSEETSKPSPVFSVPLSDSTAAAPSLKRSHNEENGPSDAKRSSLMFSSGTMAEPSNISVFGSPASTPATKPSLFQVPTAPTSSTASTGGFSFGMGGNSSTSGSLGTSTLGATTTNASGLKFSAETNKSAVLNFGAGSNTAATTTPVFGASTNNIEAKTSAPSMPFTFAAQSSVPATQALPTVFGSAQETTPAFGANTTGFSSGGSMFGSSNITPSFGASGAVPPSGFGAAGTGFSTTSSGTTPAFGAATTTTNAASTGGFSFGNSTQQSFNFGGAPSSAPANNGVFQFGAKPDGNSAAATPANTGFNAATPANTGFNFNASSSFNFGQTAQPPMPGGTGSFNIGSSNDAGSGRKIKKAIRKIRR